MASIQIREASKSYGHVKVLDGMSVDIRDGDFIILVGSSGCGKSRLLGMIAGLEGITWGEISIGKQVVNDLPPRKRDIAMVFQSYALYPHMSVAQNMAARSSSRSGRRRRSNRRSVPPPIFSACGRFSTAGRRNCRAASGSASPWAAPSCATRTCSCSTSRCPTSTHSCACRCEPRSRRCTSASRPPPSTSTTTSVLAILRERLPVRPDDRLRPALDPNQLHIFDRETGLWLS